MSHGDEAVELLPSGFGVVARSTQGNIAALENPDANIYALQYHPEVTHSEHGTKTLRHFLLNVCVVTKSLGIDTSGTCSSRRWAPSRGRSGRTTMFCVDPPGASIRWSPQLLCTGQSAIGYIVFIDNGLLRYKEGERVMATFEAKLHLPVTCINESA